MRQKGVTLATIVAFIMAGTAAVSVGCAVVLLRKRHLVGAESLAAASVAVALWAAFYGAELLVADPATAMVLGDLKYLGIVALPPAWLVFALRFTGRGHQVTGRLLAALSVHPIAVVVLLSLPGTHDLVRGAGVIGNPYGIFEVSVGPLFWVHAAYVTSVALASTVIIVRGLAAVSRRYLPQSLVLASATLLPWAANAAFNWPGPVWPVDFTPTAYAIMQLAFLWGVARFKLFAAVPVARRIVVDSLDDAVAVLDAYDRVTDLNAAGEALLGISRRRAFGRRLDTLLPEQIATTSGELRRTMVLTRHADSAVRDYEARAIPLTDGATRIPGHVVLFRDITEREQTQRRLEHLVHYDQLTGLPNRSLYVERLRQAFAVSRREHRHTGVLFVDLDNFKEVNDTHGHEVGDEVLSETAHRLRASLREIDTAIRLSGDEFVVVLPMLRDPAAGAAVARKLLSALRQPHRALGDRVAVTASIGVAVAPPSPADPDVLRRLADRAMYQAKVRGRNGYAVADGGMGAILDLTDIRSGDARHGPRPVPADIGRRRPGMEGTL